MDREGVAYICGLATVLVLLLVGLGINTLDDVQANDLGTLIRVPTYVVTIDGEQFVCTSAPGITASKVVLRSCNFLKANRAAYIGYSSVNVETRMPEGAE